MEAYIMDWLNAMLRFAHFITGIAWIGASFYFNWLENNLNRSVGQKEGISGHLWAVHGGGFYYLEKFKSYPNELPKHLHWFKWEAYFTLITGFALFCVVYYYNASSYLIKAGSDISSFTGILLSIAGMIVGWLIYDNVTKSSLVKKQWLVSLIMLVVVAISAFFYAEIFTPRAMFIQIGAMIGVIMVFNVFFVIMPSQRQLVQACVEKSELGEEIGFRGYIRSRNNNYFTLPVLFIMISNHYPIFYSGENAPIVLIAIFVITVLIRHYFNLEGEKKKGGKRTLALATILTAIAFYALIPEQIKPLKNNRVVSFEEANTIIQNRCATCHSKSPSDDTFTTAPSGFTLDTKQEIINTKDLIYTRTISSDSMPFGNKTEMTQEERQILASWLNSLSKN
ncbi:urate hydroxylase PuuD [Arcobacteraceae bacterium]|nr:urate hydroxylase PuuD [Arcobacteraceae bacterium]